MSVCPLPSGPEPEDSSKTGSGPPEAETQLCHPARAGEEEGMEALVWMPVILPLGGSCALGLPHPLPPLCPKYFGSKSLTFSSLFIHSPPG